MRVLVFAAVQAAGQAVAQVTEFTTEGNLAPTRNPGCIAVAAADPMLTPADLALGVVACAKAVNYDAATELFILMQLRSVYDTRRVSDETAHQGASVLALQVRQALGSSRLSKLQAATSRFGGTGSPRHAAFCKTVKAGGPPKYYPAYMIQHGMGAVTGTNKPPIVKGFRPRAEWRKVLRGYMKCS
jgi:hypothetical protein